MYRPTEAKQAIGQRIRQRRKLLKLDQDTVARRTGVTRAAISAYECGRMCPSEENTIALAKTLGVEQTEIVTDAERESIRAADNQHRSEMLTLMHMRRKQDSGQAMKKDASPEKAQPSTQARPAWMDDARRAAKARAEQDEQRKTDRRTRRKRSTPEPEPGATSGFIADAELADMPEFLHETLVDMHIRRMLFLCGEYRRLHSVKKTRTPLGVAWSAEEVTA